MSVVIGVLGSLVLAVVIFLGDLDELLQALPDAAAHGRHTSGEAVASIRARCNADHLPYYPAPQTAARVVPPTGPRRTPSRYGRSTP